MHDIWNPWHGCRKCSEGCRNCYMYYLDSLRDEADLQWLQQMRQMWKYGSCRLIKGSI